jgi:excisionase family DNA binding protein
MHDTTTTQPPTMEQFLTVREAAAVVGVAPWKLSRVVKSGSVPSYAIGNTRRLVRVSEIVAAVEGTRLGG